MTLRDKIASMLIMGFDGLEPMESSSVARWIKNNDLGGVILFDYCLKSEEYNKNIFSEKQVTETTTRLQSWAKKANHTPLWISVDFEGGQVNRFKHVSQSPQTYEPSVYEHMSQSQMNSVLQNMAIWLKKTGFNLNFAPLLDLSVTKSDGIIGSMGRSFSAHSDIVAEKSSHWIKQFFAHGIMSCLKHFPGHGSALGDTHLGLVDVSDTFCMDEIIPYKHVLQKNKYPLFLMTAHVVNRQLDASGVPATFSYPILTTLLRDQLHFNGIVVSDDIQMSALSAYYSLDEILASTVNAGADMIIVGNQLGMFDAEEMIDSIERLVLSKEISLARINDSAARVQEYKALML